MRPPPRPKGARGRRAGAGAQEGRDDGLAVAWSAFSCLEWVLLDSHVHIHLVCVCVCVCVRACVRVRVFKCLCV